jgi:hypothetical protein
VGLFRRGEKEGFVKLGSRAKLLLLIALFASPALAAWLTYTLWQPQRFTNYGTLLAPRALELPALKDEAGKAVDWAALRGKWVLLVAAPKGCIARCSHDSYLARQVRLAQGRDQSRIERILLGTAETVEWPHGDGAYRGTLDQLPPALAKGGLFLVDPRGNLMMGFPQDADGERVIRDMKQLLRASGEG